MSNPNVPQGFELSDSEGKQFRVRPYIKKSGNAIYRGSVVIADQNGNVDIAAASGTILGVAQEFKAASSTDPILICDDPEAVFEAMAYGDFQAGSVFNNADSKVGSADTTRNYSGSSVDMSTADADASGVRQWRILGLVTRGENAYGSFARILVKPNNHLYNKGTVGV